MLEASPIDQMRAVTRRFLAREVDAVAHDRRGALSEGALEGARALNLFGLAIPEEFGGLGLPLADVASIVAEIARVDRSLATTIGLHNGLGTRALIELAPHAVQQTWLPSLASGEGLAAFAATEPGAGSDLASLRTTTRRVREGLRVDGEKAYVTNAGSATVLTVLARDADAKGKPSGLVLVPRGARGVEVGPEERKMGLRASSTCAVRFDGALVPPAHWLSARGLEDAHRVLAWGRVLLAAGCLGTTRAALEKTLEHAGARRQFGRPLIELGAVRHHLAVMATAEATIERVLAVACASEHDLALHAGALKILASELAGDACDRAVQIHGALGFLEDPGIALLQRDCRVTRIFEGANDVLLVRHGTALIAGHGLARGADGEAGSPGPRLGELASRLDDAVLAARRDFGVSIIRQQCLLQSLARADLWLHAARCTFEAAAGAPPVRWAVFVQAARRALGHADRALDAAARSELDIKLEDELVDGLVAAQGVEA